MKMQYKLLSTAVAVAMMTSCSMHDPYNDIMEVGQSLPTVSWELGSSVATAGDSVSFKGKYYTDGEHTPDHSEVWALVAQSESAEATLKLTPTYAYTQTVTSADTIRMSQEIARYPHSMATWNGHEFEVNVKFPTSQTLRTLTWGSVEEWDANAQYIDVGQRGGMGCQRAGAFQLLFPGFFQGRVCQHCHHYPHAG